MPYVTSVERIAEARGQAQGKVEGGASVILRQLAKLCGPLPDEVQQRVRRLPIERLEVLGEAVFGFRALEDLQAWLDAHQESTQ